jgi:hypothetical protein
MAQVMEAAEFDSGCLGPRLNAIHELVERLVTFL